MGDVVLLELLKLRGRLPPFDSTVDVFCVIEDESLRLDSLKLIESLRWNGVSVDYVLTTAKPDKQIKRAQELGARHTVRLERTADQTVCVRVRNLKTRAEKLVGQSEVMAALREKAE